LKSSNKGLAKVAWKSEGLPRYEIATRPRGKPERVKESIVRFKGYKNGVRRAGNGM